MSLKCLGFTEREKHLENLNSCSTLAFFPFMYQFQRQEIIVSCDSKGCCDSLFVVEINNWNTFRTCNSYFVVPESAKWHALCAWHAHVLGVLACFICSHALCAYVIGMLYEMACLACFKKLMYLACFKKLSCLTCFIK